MTARERPKGARGEPQASEVGRHGKRPKGARSEPQAGEVGRVRPRPLVIAHRGASRERPENTLAAFELAIAQGADMIETDLHLSRDGHVVIAHDERLPGLRGEIAEHPLSEIQALDVGEGHRVPTLREVLDRFGSRIPFNLEIKASSRGDYPGLEAAVLEEVDRRGLGPRTLYSSFSHAVLCRLREASPAARLGVLVSARAAQRWRERAAAVAAEAVHFSTRQAGRRRVEAAHAARLAVHVYTVDAESEMRALLEQGVDGLFTNVPDRLRELVDDLFPQGR